MRLNCSDRKLALVRNGQLKHRLQALDASQSRRPLRTVLWSVLRPVAFAGLPAGGGQRSRPCAFLGGGPQRQPGGVVGEVREPVRGGGQTLTTGPAPARLSGFGRQVRLTSGMSAPAP